MAWFHINTEDVSNSAVTSDAIALSYFVENDPNAPPVTSTIVVLAFDDFRRHVLTCAYNIFRELPVACGVEFV